LLRIEAPDDVNVERVSLDQLPADWPDKTEVTRALGDSWLNSVSAALLTVPSAIVPETSNVLLNPAHRDAKRIVIVQAGEHAIDRRLLK
jgi:RES domain-containing protein